MKVSRRSMNEQDQLEVDERLAEIDTDVEARLKSTTPDVTTKAHAMDIDSDDDSDRGESFVNATKTIVAEG